MEIVHFDDPQSYQAHVQEYLVQREAENNLFLGVLAGMIAGEYIENKPYLAAFQDGSQLIATALCTPPWPVVVSYRELPPGQDVIHTILEDMQETLQDDFSGVQGNQEFVSCLVASWEEYSTKKALLKMAMRVYKLQEVLPPARIPGRMRSAVRADESVLGDWFAGYHQEVNKEEPKADRVIKQVNDYLTADTRVRGLKIWEVEGKAVSMAGYAGPTPNGIRVGAVYTPPDQRKNGYASALTARLSQYLLGTGHVFCFLFADLLNPTSNHIYQKIGYQPVCDVNRYLFI